jgi:soluble lytic murein transglycosylase
MHKLRRRTAPLLLLLMLLVAGCNRNAESRAPAGNDIVPTYTPTPAQGVPAASAGVQGDTAVVLDSPVAAEGAAEAPGGAVAQAPGGAPTATPPPALQSSTATPPNAAITDPLFLLNKGRQLYRVGNYPAALAALNELLSRSGLETTLALEARFELARASLANGNPTAALAALDELDVAVAATPGAGDFLGRDTFLRAQALEASGAYDAAIQAWWTFLEAYPWMNEYVQPRIADGYIALDNVDAAADALRRAADASGNPPAKSRLLEREAQIFNDAGRPADAANALLAILDFAQNSVYRTSIRYQTGTALANAGNEPAAIEQWRAATAEAPATTAAYLSLVELVNRNVEFDLVDRGYIDLIEGAYLPAINAYSAFLENADPTDARYATALLGLAQSYIGAEDPASAIPLLDRIINEFPASGVFGQAWLEKATALAAQGDEAGARRLLRTFARDYAADTLAPEALWQSASMALRVGNDVEAAVDLLALAELFPQSTRAADALYTVGTGALRAGLQGQAVASYTRLQNEYPDYRWPGVAYWLGRAHAANNEPDAARVVWQALVDRAPDIYYGVLAAQALQGLPVTDAAMLANVAQIVGPPSRVAGDDGSQAFAEQWLLQWDAFAGVTNPAALPDAIATDQNLRAGRLLLQVDDRINANDALDRLYERFKDDPQALYPLALEFARIGAYRHSITSMSRLLQFSPAGLVENAPIFLQSFVYPRYFDELITAEARAHNMDPFLYYGMIRQESLFEEGARSYAAAQGLAQIIPDTARWVAEQQGHPDWSNDLIYRPYINVNFGAYYFDWVRLYLDGNEVSALVGYNAGPGNAKTWRELSGADDTQFVEILTYSEPRLYVQLITENLYHYTRLYGTP